MGLLEHEAVVLLHAHVGDEEVGVWFGVIQELASHIIVGAFFIDCNLRSVFSSL